MTTKNNENELIEKDEYDKVNKKSKGHGVRVRK